MCLRVRALVRNETLDVTAATKPAEIDSRRTAKSKGDHEMDSGEHIFVRAFGDVQLLVYRICA